jgi:hypothetical protein
VSGLTELLAKAGWTIPDGFEPISAATCHRCGRQVLRCRSERWVGPLNRDGSKHPMECRINTNTVRANTHPLYRDEGAMRRCPKCCGSTFRYSVLDLGAHMKQAHRGS